MAIERKTEDVARAAAGGGEDVARAAADEVARNAADGVEMARQNIQHLMTASERVMTGVVNAAAKQLEVSRTLLQGGLEDFDRLAQARTPESFLQAELEILRRRSERMLNAMQTVSEELTRAWSDAFELARPNEGRPRGRQPEQARA